MVCFGKEEGRPGACACVPCDSQVHGTYVQGYEVNDFACAWAWVCTYTECGMVVENGDEGVWLVPPGFCLGIVTLAVVHLSINL